MTEHQKRISEAMKRWWRGRKARREVEKHAPVTASKEYQSAADLHRDIRLQTIDLEMAWHRERLRYAAKVERDARRNSMIGRLDDCRWRVSVLMASKKLPADYAMRLR